MAESTSPGITATIVGMTDVGLVRDHNEDAFLVLDTKTRATSENGALARADLQSAVVMAVADGMGGAAAGEVASRMTSDRLAENLGSAPYDEITPDQIVALMDEAVQQANMEILTEAQTNADRKGMGTTVTAAIALGNRLFISQVGDSRAYLLRKGKLVQLTKDQSLIGQLIEEGTLTEEEAEKLGGRNIVLQAVGVEENLRVDTKHWEMLRGDTVLLCSDGLSGMITDAEMEAILNEAGSDLQAAATKLIAGANEGGGRDNITTVVVRFEGEGLRPPMEALESGGVERAGASFQAPPPPEVPNPMRKVGIVGVVAIAAILALLFLLRPTTASVKFEWEPSDVPIKLKLTDAEQATVHEESHEGGSFLLEDLEPGLYQLEHSAAHYQTETPKIDLTGKTGETLVEIHLFPLNGKVEIVSATPHVQVELTAEGSGHPDQKLASETILLRIAGRTREVEDMPAGPVRIHVTRSGFEPYDEEKTLLPEDRVDFSIPALVPRMGTLVVKGEGGFVVTVTDEYGESLAPPGTTAGGGSELRLPVREGTHVLDAAREGFEPTQAQVVIRKGEATSYTIDARVKQVVVTFHGPKESAVLLERRTASGAFTKFGSAIYLKADGVSRGQRLSPGTYRAVCGDLSKTFDVDPGAGDLTVKLGGN